MGLLEAVEYFDSADEDVSWDQISPEFDVDLL